MHGQQDLCGNPALCSSLPGNDMDCGADRLWLTGGNVSRPSLHYYLHMRSLIEKEAEKMREVKLQALERAFNFFQHYHVCICVCARVL
jgi:hypothetical protein